VKNENIVGKKMTRNGQKTAIRAGGLGWLLLDRDHVFSFIVVSLVTSNPQTMNLVFPNFFHDIFSVEQLKKKLFIGPKLRKKNLFWTNKKIVIFFNCLNREKIGENKIGCLMS
jgi:hypothetical protein